MTSNQPNSLILIAQPNAVAREAKARTLLDAGFQVGEASTIDEVMISISSARPNLILLDSDLLSDKGSALCHELKKNPATQAIMILQISNSVDDSSGNQIRSDVDADSYLIEPIQTAELIANIKLLLRFEATQRQLAEHEQWKSKFLATFAILTHDLRNILAPILNSIELLFKLDPVVPQMQTKARDTIKLQAKSLVGVADALLDASQQLREQSLLHPEQPELYRNTISTSSDEVTQRNNSETSTDKNVQNCPEATAIETSIPKRVLVVDDYADVADTLAQWLRLAGHNVRTAYTGAEALEFTAEFKPDIVLLDIGLPDSSGFDIAKKLRAIPNLEKFLLVAVTGYGQASLRKSVLEAGFDEHFAKPMNFEKLGSIGLHV